MNKTKVAEWALWGALILAGLTLFFGGLGIVSEVVSRHPLLVVTLLAGCTVLSVLFYINPGLDFDHEFSSTREGVLTSLMIVSGVLIVITFLTYSKTQVYLERFILGGKIKHSRDTVENDEGDDEDVTHYYLEGVNSNSKDIIDYTFFTLLIGSGLLQYQLHKRATAYAKSQPPRPKRRRWDYKKGLAALEEGTKLMDDNKFEEALEKLTFAIDNGVKDAYIQRGNALNGLSRWKEAIVDFDNAIARTPSDCNLYFCRGHAKHASNDFTGALLDRDWLLELAKADTSINRWRYKEKVDHKYHADLRSQYLMLTMMWESDLHTFVERRDDLRKAIEIGDTNKIKLAQHMIAFLYNGYDEDLIKEEE